VAWIGLLLDLAASGRFLRQRKMSLIIVVVADVLIQKTFQMPFIEDEQMVEQVPVAVANPPLSHAILPRTSVTGNLGLVAKALHNFDYVAVEIRVAIKDQVSGWGVKRKRLAQLLNNPSTGRMFGHIPVNDASLITRNNQDAIENTEGKRWHGEEVHRSNSLAMITQKGRPALCRLSIFEVLFESSAERCAPKC
jgi:hypothetical protein